MTMVLQYSTMKDGSALGVAVTRSALLTHCRSLSTACLYKEGESSLRKRVGEKSGRKEGRGRETDNS